MEKNNLPKNIELAVIGGGCFWCLDAVFSRVKGVASIVSGYAGGTKENPVYEQVSMGNTGHAEVVKIEYDSKTISYEEILRLFFSVHNPTTPNRQGNDIGSQYRSIILYDNINQKTRAEKIIQKLEKGEIYPDPIVTELVPLQNFYPAEEYHQKYFEKNPEKAYCQIVISPKIAKLRKNFARYYSAEH